jgi:mannan endo-1,4-beta-mannosidase
VTAQAESGSLAGVSVGNTVAGFTGDGYVEGFDAASDSVTVTIPDSPGGLFDLVIRYAAPYGQKSASLQLNGVGSGELKLTQSAGFTDLRAGKLLLNPGKNTVAMVSSWGWYLIDSLSLTPALPPQPHRTKAALVNEHATAEAKGLMRYLVAQYGKKVLSGQQEATSIAWVEQNVGKAPAVAGLDMIDYSPSRVERGATSTEVEDALAWDARGGIVTFSWHWNAPSGLTEEDGKSLRAFYADATTFDLQATLADRSGADFKLLIRDIDAIAVQLKRLADAKIPVLWRPLHEAEGAWFWWGAKGPQPAKELWRIMYERLTKHHKLNNLIWVWNSLSPEWYPGDDVVDIVSTDVYAATGDHGPMSSQYEDLIDLGKDQKLVALGEVGSIPDPQLLASYHCDFSWFVTWTNDFIKDGVLNPRDFLKRIYNDPYVITLDEVGDFKH